MGLGLARVGAGRMAEGVLLPPPGFGAVGVRTRVDSDGAPPTVPAMKAFTAVIERCSDTGLYVGFVPGFAGAHSQGETLDELQRNLREVIEMLMEDGEPELEAEFVGTQSITVAA